MWYSTQLVITWLVHWFMDSMALMICKDIIDYCSSFNDIVPLWFTLRSLVAAVSL